MSDGRSKEGALTTTTPVIPTPSQSGRADG
jgi:hypothetical protein